MKIGILTFHCAHNYGAVLQCYALQKTLEEMGQYVEVINYRPEYILKQYRPLPRYRMCFRKPAALAKNLWYELTCVIPRWYSFEKFIRKRLCLSKEISAKILPGDYDIIIIGSDQIWNPDITYGIDSTFWGQGYVGGAAPCLAYSASMGKCDIDPSIEKYVISALKEFKAISVRENVLAQKLMKICGRDITTTLDPTLLHDSLFWKSVAKKPAFNGKYILIYQVVHSEATLETAQHLAGKNGAEIITIASRVYPEVKNKHTKVVVSPEEFLGWILYADYVVTTSFHGTVFSIIFEKQFNTINLMNAWGQRSKSLLEQLNLTNRLISGVDDLTCHCNKIDYVNVKARLKELTKSSYDFLNENISR